MNGSLPRSNSTSTTGPMIWTTLPVFIHSSVAGLLQGFRAAHQFGDFLGDDGLTDAVGIKSEAADQVFAVAAGVVHGGHAGREFAGLAFEKGFPYLHLNGAGHK